MAEVGHRDEGLAIRVAKFADDLDEVSFAKVCLERWHRIFVGDQHVMNRGEDLAFASDLRELVGLEREPTRFMTAGALAEYNLSDDLAAKDDLIGAGDIHSWHGKRTRSVWCVCKQYIALRGHAIEFFDLRENS